MKFAQILLFMLLGPAAFAGEVLEVQTCLTLLGGTGRGREVLSPILRSKGYDVVSGSLDASVSHFLYIDFNGLRSDVPNHFKLENLSFEIIISLNERKTNNERYLFRSPFSTECVKKEFDDTCWFKLLEIEMMLAKTLPDCKVK